MRDLEFYAHETARRAAARTAPRPAAVATRRPAVRNVVRSASPAIVRLPGDSAAVTGTLAEVSAVLDQFRRAGILIGHNDPLPTGLPGQDVVTARLLPAGPLPGTVANRGPA